MVEIKTEERIHPLGEVRIPPGKDQIEIAPFGSKEEQPAAGGPETGAREELGVSPEAQAAMLQANAFVIKTCVEALGNTAYQLTKVEAAKCDDISDPLAAVWAPFLPQMPPITQALVVTISLVGPKVGMVVLELRARKKPRVEVKENVPATGLPQTQN